MRSWRTSQHGCGSHRSKCPFRPTGGGEHDERAEDLDSSQRVRDHLVVYHLSPAITDFIAYQTQECHHNDLEQTLTLPHSEWSKEIEPSRHTIHSMSATQLTRKVRSSSVEACDGKRPRCQQLHMTLASFVNNAGRRTDF